MPHYAIVIKDPPLAHAKEVERNVAANLAAGSLSAETHGARVELRVRQFVGAPKQVGDLHTVCEEACPEGLPNCRNCGDPAHAEACAAAGHCPDCGTKHGIAPASVVAANGYDLIAVEPSAEGHVWDRDQRSFVPPKE